MKFLLLFLFLVYVLAKEDYYKILGLQKGADIDKVKKQFRKLSLKYHPDKNKSPQAEEKYKQITHAYQQIVDGNLDDEQPYVRDFRDFGPNQRAYTYNNRNYYFYSNNNVRQEQEKGSTISFSLIFIVLIVVVGIQLINFVKPSQPNQQQEQKTTNTQTQATHSLPKDIIEKVSNVSSYTESDRRSKFSQMYNQ